MKITTHNLSKSFGNKQAVKNLNIEIRPGQILGLLGPNGAGKSTTIKMLTGQLEPTSGTIVIDGKEYLHIPHDVRNNIGVMPQEVIIWEELNITENLELTAALQKMPKKDARERIDFIMEGLMLTKEANTVGKNLSGGYKRRVNLAISIIHNPSAVFLDEPTPGVDAQTRRFLWDFIRSLKTENRAVVLTDHYLEEAEKLSDYVVIIDDGEVIAEGTVDKLKHEYSEGASVVITFEQDEQDVVIEKVEATLSKKFPQVSKAGTKITILEKDGVSVIKYLSSYFDEEGITPDSISLREPTLEDVFLILTGKHIRE